MSGLFAGDWRSFPPVLAALTRIGEPAVPALVAGLASISDEQARARIAYALGRIGGAGAVAALRPMLRAAPGQPRAQAWSALLSIGGRPALPGARRVACRPRTGPAGGRGHRTGPPRPTRP